MSPASQEQLAPQGIVSIFVAPVFLNDYFWGFIGFDDCHKEKVFSENEELILRSAGLLIANSMLRNEMTANLQSSSVQLEKALKEAQAANEAKSIFLSNMSHEIRTPMNAITGMGELLLHEQLNERQLGYVDDIVVSANALLGIINDILDFSKIESGKLELNPVDYDFMAFIDHIKSMFDYVAEKKGLEFILECGENLPLFFFGDDLRLRQTLTNILGNAIKFTEKGHVCLKVTESENSLIFVIRDTGIGIRKEDLPKLFNAFEQVDKSKNRNVVGTGLGLAISKSFVEMMGGSIKLESEYGQGTVFTITIPIVLGSKERIINRSAYIESHAFHAPEADILVVDDNEFNLRVAYGLLNLMEIEADTADSGFKAIDLVKEKDYDIVFMDHMMPEMDGVDTVREIRKLGGKFENLIIIALTANVVKNAQDMFLSSGFNDFLAKPIEVGELYDIVRKYLPEGKIRTVDMTEDVKARASKGDELYRKAIVTFVKENHFTFDNISASLLSGDMKTAHRIAHTLKSSAGFLEKKELQDAAFSLEQSLQCEPPVYTPRQLEVLELELRKALHEYEPMVAAMESVKPDAVEVDGRELSSLLSELEPLLVQGDFGAVDYVEKLQGIAGMKELAERIDDYDFENALNILKQFTA
jgi:signal transduction histidine kinase/CheY-like chemotaxis protein